MKLAMLDPAPGTIPTKVPITLDRTRFSQSASTSLSVLKAPLKLLLVLSASRACLSDRMLMTSGTE